MVKSLTCVPKAGLSGNETADLFSTVCGLDKNACAGINANATLGVYGAYSMCDPYSKLAFAFDQYYQIQSKASTACDFGGNAGIQSGSVASECKALISQAGTAGTGTVTTVPTGTAIAGGGGSAASPSKSTGAAVHGTTVPAFNTGMLLMGAYVVVTGLAGAGMILL
jgi:hypothetical protein